MVKDLPVVRFFAIGSQFVDISFAGVFDIFWTFLTHFS